MKRKKASITSGCLEHELVKSEALSSSFNDSGSCGLGESQGGNSKLGEVNESNVISHSANHDGDSVPIQEPELIPRFEEDMQ